jgi:hypothetical protein
VISANLPACTGGCAITGYTVAIRIQTGAGATLVTDFRDITASCAEVSALTPGALAGSQRYVPSPQCTVPISVLESVTYAL